MEIFRTEGAQILIRVHDPSLDRQSGHSSFRDDAVQLKDIGRIRVVALIGSIRRYADRGADPGKAVDHGADQRAIKLK
jgi:hypothetical protein